jgi:hypothetical protein
MQEIPIDYLETYVTDGGFDVPRLINDDFFLAIRLCFQAGHYASCSKLLVCFIDTIGFVRYGADTKVPPFVTWCDAYMDMKKLGVTSDELWEHRNALLHTTTLMSRKITAKKSAMLVCYVGNLPARVTPPLGEKWFNLNHLIDEVAQGISRFIADFVSHEPELFMKRYDLIISDRRKFMARV